MKIDWNRGTIDFTQKPAAARLTPVRLLIGAVLIPLGLILGWIGVLPIIHEIGHAVGATLVGGKATIHWDYCYSWLPRYNPFTNGFVAMSGSLFGTILWTCIALLLIKKHPELSTFPMAYAAADVFAVASQSHIATTDLYKNPIGSVIVFTGMMGCIVFYVIRLTGGLQKWRIQGVLFKSRSKGV